MRLLLDTQILLWAAGAPERLKPPVREMLENRENTLVFSVASLWEISVRPDQVRRDQGRRVDGTALRRGLLRHGYEEMMISGVHVLMAEVLPAIHDDPFDRILVAQARQDGLTLITGNAVLAQYPGTIRHV